MRVTLDDRLEYLLCDTRDNSLQLVIVNVCALHRNVYHEFRIRVKGLAARTIMVNVFPLPVCPYANTVPL